MVKQNDPDPGGEGDSFDERRKELVDRLKKRGYVESKDVEEAFLAVPREEFVPEEVRAQAYQDRPLRIGQGQTISAPHMVAMMTEILDLSEGLKTLEIGTGRGYHAAIVAAVVGGESVYTVERHESLAKNARQNLEKSGYSDVTVVVGDGSKGYEDEAPYDRIYLTCAAPDIPDDLKNQLKDGGKIVLPIGKTSQTLYSATKKGEEFTRESHGGVRFVPLLGEEGF